ncbi:DUF1311 domain-containing protein [Salinarimonas soli]|uniref:DUF1311 domain-containing protein n=1 Tax=Salinarimonas soli TaxID=1638099 RepID=A0A5B2VG09_9HYPH|nr:DUF1311 domain-containing protein [Salinarimonas soli]KAA2237302.1 DUF1311 domain-containing protein [Salinarimonas soli]
MTLPRLALLTLLCAALPAGAQAQFWPFGARTNEPPVPPASVPTAPAAPAQPQPGAPLSLGVPAQPGAPGQPSQAQPAGPPQPRPAAVRTASEDEVVGRDLRRNGEAGRLRIERAARGALTARLTLDGTRISKPGQACQVKVADGEPIPLSAQGRPEGSLRFAIETPACPMAFDVLEGAVLVPAATAACVVEAADCRAEMHGLWGLEPAALAPLARAIETARGDADRAVRENYKVLSQRAGPGQVRAIVSEQAAFSSERDVACRDYAREANHGFCNARFTAARAASLAGKLGLISTAPTPAPAARRPAAPGPQAGPNPPATGTAPRAQPF